MRGITFNDDGSFTVAPNNPIHSFIKDAVENYILGPTSRSLGGNTIAMQEWRAPDRHNYMPMALALDEYGEGGKTRFKLLEYTKERNTGGVRGSPVKIDIGSMSDLQWLASVSLKRLAGVDAIGLMWTVKDFGDI